MKLPIARRSLAVSILSLAFWHPPLNAQPSHDACARPQVGSMVGEPLDVRSKDGVLEITPISLFDSTSSEPIWSHAHGSAESAAANESTNWQLHKSHWRSRPP